MKSFLLGCLISFILIGSQNVFSIDGARIIKSFPEDKIQLTVLPIKNLSDEIHAGSIITETITAYFSGSELVSVLPMRVMVESLWKYYPGLFSITPSAGVPNLHDLELFGGLELEQKQYFSTQIGTQYLIDGTYIKESGQRKLILNLYSVDEDKTVISLTANVTLPDTPSTVAKKLAGKIERHFFEQYADLLVLNLINKTHSEQVNSQDAQNIFINWIKNYGGDLFVFAGLMILKNESNASPSEIIRYGKQWFALKDENVSRQIKFFKSLDANPYLILGKAYMVRADYSEAQEILYAGNNTFPFNSGELIDELILCLNLSGKKEKAELLKKQRKEQNN